MAPQKDHGRSADVPQAQRAPGGVAPLGRGKAVMNVRIGHHGGKAVPVAGASGSAFW